MLPSEPSLFFMITSKLLLSGKREGLGWTQRQIDKRSVISGLKLITRNCNWQCFPALDMNQKQNPASCLVLMGIEMLAVLPRPPTCPSRMCAVRDGQASQQTPPHATSDSETKQWGEQRGHGPERTIKRAHHRQQSQGLPMRQTKGQGKSRPSSQFLCSRIRYFLQTSTCYAFLFFLVAIYFYQVVSSNDMNWRWCRPFVFEFIGYCLFTSSWT